MTTSAAPGTGVPTGMPTGTALPPDVWLPLAQAHADRADALTAAYRDRRTRGERHAIDDFLYDYYGVKPSHLRRWHPGPGVVLAGSDDELAAHASWRWYRRGGGGGAPGGGRVPGNGRATVCKSGTRTNRYAPSCL